MASAGDSFILKGHGQRTAHLWALLWGPAGPADAFIAVSFTTLKPHKDRTCVVNVGDHAFIQHATCVMYSDARRITREKLEAAFASRSAFPQARLSPELLERVRTGLLASPFTPHAILELARSVQRV